MTLPFSAWALYTRLGEIQILLPAMAVAALWLALARRTRPLATAWAAGGAAAIGLTTATKIAFIGFAIGIAALDFTGLSGHAMSAALVLPVLARLAAGRAAPPWPPAAVVLGYALAAGVAVSRVVVGAHSASEAVSGFVIGAAASAFALRAAPGPATLPPRWLLALVALWLLAFPIGGPASRTHDEVTALSLRLSGRATPYTRHEMHRDARRAALRKASGGARPGLQRQPVAERQGGERLGGDVLDDLES